MSTLKLVARKAERHQKKLKLALNGPSGSGKTYTALAIAEGLKNGGRVLVGDTERGSASLYADRFDFDVIELPDYTVDTYLEVIRYAVNNNYDVLTIDSLSHAWWELLEEHDRRTTADARRDSFGAWRKVTPIYNQLIQGIVTAPVHIIATMRSKSEYVVDQVEKNGRNYSVPRKVGLAPIFRDGGEYEFDVVCNIDLDHNLIVEKTRIDIIADKVINKAGSNFGKTLSDWLKAALPERAPVAVATPTIAETAKPVVTPAAISAAKAEVAAVKSNGAHTSPPPAVEEDAEDYGDVTDNNTPLMFNFGQLAEKKVMVNQVAPASVRKYLERWGQKESPAWVARVNMYLEGLGNENN